MSQPYKIQRSETITIIYPQYHRHTLIWIHGLNQFHEKHLPNIIQELKSHISQVKIIIPRAPNRYVTTMKSEASSWFDIKFRSQKSFIVPFDEAFSSEQVYDSFDKILQPIIGKESQIVKQKGGKLIVCGFSQGGGMSLHCLYSEPKLVDAAIAISGYLFPITKFDSGINNYVHIIYGLADELRPWKYTKTTYEGKIEPKSITLIEGMKHELNQKTNIALSEQLHVILGDMSKL